ncbi:hypothetical protein EDD18DRAFT_1468404 [Armillaria luteobubalina]|uniref:FAD dependent oxidoreductase domain-containing protein n=1 Tax=Armillaria luteobubalina TaxID=153913 RepID=A0AA39PB88_9AGAR|nr:hypothetical protein EDD18DRAFT_1468404 [Armillaria luteobubalina]
MSSPGFPSPNACLSFWLQGVRSSPLIGHCTTEELPTTGDVIIIGSGITGASMTYFLLTGENPPKSVVMLEAREMCDSATGQNGGHSSSLTLLSHELGYNAAGWMAFTVEMEVANQGRVFPYGQTQWNNWLVRAGGNPAKLRVKDFFEPADHVEVI